MHPEQKPTRIRWQLATCLNGCVCSACRRNYRQDKGPEPFYPHGFLMEICQQFNTYPAWRIPHLKARLRGMVRRHYKKCHPEYQII